MALTTLYFSDTSAGAADGTSWANRAAFVVSNALNTLITGFNFTSNALLCLVEGGKTYSITTAPTVTNSANYPLYLRSCDNAGNEVAPPSPAWTSDQPSYSTSTFATLSTTTNINALGSTNTHVRCFKFTGSGNTTNNVIGASVQSLDWCVVSCSGALSSGVAVGAVKAENCVFTVSNATYNAIATTQIQTNCRLEGNASASSGNRQGVRISGAANNIVRVTVINNPGGNLVFTSSSTSFATVIQNCMILGGGSGIVFPGTSSTTTHSLIAGCYIANASAWGIDLGTNTSPAVIVGNRMRDNGSGNVTNAGSLDSSNTYTTDSDDATELVDAGSGDYRIKSSASNVWGKGYGVSDQASAGGTPAFASIG